jgi:predicted signal transduction protein with EAL and GGDEF domain
MATTGYLPACRRGDVPAKEKGRTVQFYTAELPSRGAPFQLESALQLAPTRGELLLHFQPKIDIAGGRMVSIEALLRWQHRRVARRRWSSFPG